MAGCNCKNKNLNDKVSNEDTVNNDGNPIHNSFISKVLIIGLKIILTTFIGIIAIPFIILFTEYTLFKSIVFNSTIDFDKFRNYVTNKLKFMIKDDEDDDDDDDDDDDEENHEEYEYKLFDVEEINENESKKV